MSNSTVPIKEFRLELSDLTYRVTIWSAPNQSLLSPMACC